jgi:hypothetical protein
VIDVPNEHHDADDDEQECDDDRDAWNDAATIRLHFTQRQYCVSKSTDENADGELTRLVLEDALHDSR